MTVAVFAFLSRYLCQTTALLFAKSDRELYILGAMPFVYYVFDYSTTKFSMLLYSGNKVVVEFLAFAMCISYVIFLFVYFQEYELKNSAEQYGQLTNMQLNSLHSEIEQVRSSEHRMKILRHDMRHHLAAIQTFISQQEPERALDYIQEINKQYDDTVIHSFCRNELLNSVLSIYQTRFAENQIVFDVQIQTSQTLCCSEMTFCAILSNLLENAIRHSGDTEHIQIASYAKDSFAVIEVSDHGRGLNATENDGEEPSSDSSKGLGIGLPVCESIVKAHKGFFEKENRPGGGAVFRFGLPMEEVTQDE